MYHSWPAQDPEFLNKTIDEKLVTKEFLAEQVAKLATKEELDVLRQEVHRQGILAEERGHKQDLITEAGFTGPEHFWYRVTEILHSLL